MKKKKVTAPLTYDPGKGRPKEHLAYLNYQEMQALKRLNGNNQERGPMGLPSFPPGGTTGKSSSSSSSTNKSYGGGGKMGSSSSQSGGAKSSTKSSVGGGKASSASKIGSAASVTKSTGYGGVGRDVGAGRSGGGGGPRSGAAGTRSPTSGSATGSGKGPSMSKDTGGKSPAPRSGLEGSRSPTSGSKFSSSGQKPGGIADIGGGKRAANDTPGSKIKGAIAAVKNPVTYNTAPRYNQPQAQRMANPTAIPSMERTSAERMNLAEAARRREATAAALTARNGPFGAPSYTGTYNPATNRYDARPVASAPSVRMDPGIAARLSPAKYSPSVPGKIAADPSLAGRLAQANENYKTVTGPGGMVSRVYSDPDIKGPTLGETISGYASRVADAVFGPDTQKMAQQYTDSFTDFGNRFAGAMDTMTPAPSTPAPGPQRMYDGSFGPQLPSKTYYDRIAPTQPAAPPRQFAEKTYSATTPQRVYDQPDLKTELSKAAVRMNEMERAIRAEQVDPRLSAEQTLRAYEEQKRAAPRTGARPVSLSNPVSISYNADPDVMGFIGDTTTSRALSGFGNVAPARETFQGRIEPMGSATGQKTRSVEAVPGEGIVGLAGAEARAAAKAAGIPASVYNRPGFAEDVNQLGIGVPAQGKISPTDMAKLHARAYGEGYLTPEEKRRGAVIGGVEKVVLGGANMAVPGTSTAVKQTKKAMGIETPKEFLSRPSYEQDYLRDVARAESIRMGRDPLGRTSYTTADGQTVQRAGPSFGQGGDRGGIASLTVPTRTVAPTPTESTTGTGSNNDSGGGRPYIHFQWDLGLNVPAPTDPNYADYQKYLANRAASAAALESA